MRLRGVAFTLAALAVGAAVGWLMLLDAGYVFVSFGRRTFETSVWFALFALLAVLGAVALALRLIRQSLQGRSRLAAWSRRRRDRHALGQTIAGFVQLLEGKWQPARKSFEDVAGRAAMPVLNYLAAARAAHELGDSEGRDALFEQAAAAAPEARAGIALQRARLLLDAGDSRGCHAVLSGLLAEAPGHPQALAMLLRCQERLRDWRGALDVVARMKKAKAAEAATLESAVRRIWRQGLTGACEANDAAQAREIWHAAPKKLRATAALTLPYAEALAAAGEGDEAERALRAALKTAFDPALVNCYGRVCSTKLEGQLAAAQGWLTEHPNDAALLLALGRLSLAAGQRDKAFEYLEASLSADVSAECCVELGRLHLACGELQRGRELLERALAAPPLPTLPESAD